MINVIDNKNCTGCTACMNICPTGAITMCEDKDGFKYPSIDKEKCINCGACQKKCPVINTKNNEVLNKCYVGYNKNNDELLKASSGAVFSLIADKILEENGIVIGAAFDNKNKLKHIVIRNKKDLDKLKGSKYLQSDLSDIFSYIKDNIKSKKILFVGTPCQVAGLKAVVKNNTNLICIDLICHGVPSQKIFDKYLESLETKHNDKVKNYNFRDKSTGWDTYSNNIKFKNKQVSQLAKDNPYMKLFLSDIALRKSCYNCNFKLGNKYSDITLGDFWGISKYYPDMYNKSGVSAIIINTENGKKIFESIKDDLKFAECNLEEIVEGNPSLKYSSKMSKNRTEFIEDLDKKDFNQLAKKYIKKDNILIRGLRYLKRKIIS